MSAGSECCVADGVGVGTEDDILEDGDEMDDKADGDADLDDDEAADLVFWAGPITCCKIRVYVRVLGSACYLWPVQGHKRLSQSHAQEARTAGCIHLYKGTKGYLVK